MNRRPGTGTMRILAEGEHLRLVERNGWELVERTTAPGAVVILARTDGGVIFVEQYREPVEARVIELPAGLIDRNTDGSAQSGEDTARRELLEETGYEAQRMIALGGGPTSAGLGTETVDFYLAMNLAKRHEGGGIEHEEITVHIVPLAEVRTFAASRSKAGCLVDPKLWAAFFLAAPYDAEIARMFASANT